GSCRGAGAVCSLSSWGGCGRPRGEMRACGGAVLASTAGALAETLGGQAHLVEPLDVDGWRDALLRVGEDDDWWRALRRGAVEAARPYTWEQCAADTLRVSPALCGPGGGPGRPAAGAGGRGPGADPTIGGGAREEEVRG